MPKDVDKLSFDVGGKDAVEAAMDILDRYTDERFDKVHIEIVATEDDSNARQSTIVAEPPRSTERGKDKSEPRGIRRDTSHHRVLSALSQFTDEMPVPTKRILDIVDLPEGTAYAAMSDLHDRGLVKRTGSGSGSNSYEYEFTEAGKDELDRLGTIE